MNGTDKSSLDDFVQRYSGIYEHSPWVAREAAAEAAECRSVECIAEIMAGFVQQERRDLAF